MGVKAGGGFIQQQQAARHQQRAGDRDTLRLADRQTARLIAHGGMDPCGSRAINSLTQALSSAS
jgi:hypothetical protein